MHINTPTSGYVSVHYVAVIKLRSFRWRDYFVLSDGPNVISKEGPYWWETRGSELNRKRCGSGSRCHSDKQGAKECG